MLLFIRFHPRSAQPAGAASSRPEEDGSPDAGRAETGRAMLAEDAELVPAASPPALLAVGSGQPPGGHRNAGPWATWRASGSNEWVGDTGSGPVSGPGELRLCRVLGGLSRHLRFGKGPVFCRSHGAASERNERGTTTCLLMPQQFSSIYCLPSTWALPITPIC